MKRIVVLRVHEFLQLVVGLFSRHSRAYQSQALGHTVDVGIHWKGMPAQRKEEHDGSRLGPHTP